MSYKSDIEIAQSVEMKHIKEIAFTAGIDEKYLEQYGNYKAKVDLSILNDKLLTFFPYFGIILL